MESIWTNGNCQNSIVKIFLEQGIRAAKSNDHHRAFQLFKRVYQGINWHSPQKDSVLKFKVLRLIGYAGFKAKQFQEAKRCFSLALEMGERLFPQKSTEEKEKTRWMVQRCSMLTDRFRDEKTQP